MVARGSQRRRGGRGASQSCAHITYRRTVRHGGCSAYMIGTTALYSWNALPFERSAHHTKPSRNNDQLMPEIALHSRIQPFALRTPPPPPLGRFLKLDMTDISTATTLPNIKREDVCGKMRRDHPTTPSAGLTPLLLWRHRSRFPENRLESNTGFNHWSEGGGVLRAKGCTVVHDIQLNSTVNLSTAKDKPTQNDESTHVGPTLLVP